MARGRRNGSDGSPETIIHAEDIEGMEGMEGSEGEGRPEHNSIARAAIIRETCEAVAEYDRQIASLKAEKKAVIETRIVADLGMKKAHFAAAYKLYGAGQEERDGLFDVMRECFAALGVGMQSSFLDVLAAVDGAAAQ